MPIPAETIKKDVKLEAIEGSQAVQKHTNSRRRFCHEIHIDKFIDEMG